MAKKIRLSDLRDTPCYRYRKYIAETYGIDGVFDPVDVFRNVPGGAKPDDVRWLMYHCLKARTKSILNYLLSIETYSREVSSVIANYHIARTKAVLQHYLDMQPSAGDVEWLINNCEYARRNAKPLREYMDNWYKM